MDLAAASNLAIATGRVAGDIGQPSFVGYYKDRRSRPDHVMLSPALYKLAQAFQMLDTFASDHCGLSMAFNVDGNSGGMNVAAERKHMCQAELCDNKLMLRWDHDRAFAYAQHLVNNAELLHQFDEAEAAGDADKLAFCVRSLVIQAASDRAVGMSSLSKCALMRARKQKGPLSPIWFNDECHMKRKWFIEAVKRGEAKHACMFLRIESRKCNRRTKRRHQRQQRALFLDRLYRKDPHIHAMLRKRKTSQATPVTSDEWDRHLHSHFRVQPTVPQQDRRSCAARSAGGSRLS